MQTCQTRCTPNYPCNAQPQADPTAVWACGVLASRNLPPMMSMDVHHQCMLCAQRAVPCRHASALCSIRLLARGSIMPCSLL